jgi:hypothetical protein
LIKKGAGSGLEKLVFGQNKPESDFSRLAPHALLGVGGKGCAGMRRRISGSSLYKEYRNFLILGINSSYG